MTFSHVSLGRDTHSLSPPLHLYCFCFNSTSSIDLWYICVYFGPLCKLSKHGAWESILSTRNCRKSTQVINFDQNDVCVFTTILYLLNPLLVDEKRWRFLSAKFLYFTTNCRKPVLLTSTSFSLSLSTLKNVNRFFFQEFLVLH